MRVDDRRQVDLSALDLLFQERGDSGIPVSDSGCE